MRIAATYDAGDIFQHFGRTEQFKLYDAVDGKITAAEVVGTDGKGHGMLADVLKSKQVDALICGGIGEGAKNMLAAAGIKLYGGVAGSADDAVAALLAGKLQHDPNVACSHHEGHGHGEGEGCHGGHGENGGHSCGGHCHH